MYQRHQKLVPEPTIVHCSSTLSGCPEKHFPQTKKQLFDVKSVIITCTSNECCNVQDVQNSHTSVGVHINNRNRQHVFFFQSLFELCDKSVPQTNLQCSFDCCICCNALNFSVWPNITNTKFLNPFHRRREIKSSKSVVQAHVLLLKPMQKIHFLGFSLKCHLTYLQL